MGKGLPIAVLCALPVVACAALLRVDDVGYGGADASAFGDAGDAGDEFV